MRSPAGGHFYGPSWPARNSASCGFAIARICLPGRTAPMAPGIGSRMFGDGRQRDLLPLPELGGRLDVLLCAICRGGFDRESARGGLTRIGAALQSQRSTLWLAARQWRRRVGAVERSWSLPALSLRWLASRSHRLTFRPRMKRFGCFSVAVAATTLSLMGRQKE